MADGYIDITPIIRAINKAEENVNRNLQTVDLHINSVHNAVDSVDTNAKIIKTEVEKLAEEFHEFVGKQIRANRLGIANTKIVSLKQDLEKQFGHHDIVRRHTTGILEAADLELVRSSTLTTATEEMFLNCPGYWLAPCLVALAAWINDQPELADKALREALKRDDEKTSLLFALICRRASRENACLKWTQRYLAYQDEKDLDRNCIIVLDAFASGLLGADSEGVVVEQMNTWMTFLSLEEDFVEQQTKQWSAAINARKKPYHGEARYHNLNIYSKTWPAMAVAMEGAYLHATVLSYFENIFNQESSTDTLKMQLDEILTKLVTDFEAAELPLRQEIRFEQFVIDFNGDEKRAQANMAVEQTALEQHKDFAALLTDAAMKPESSGASVSTQKFAIALSRDRIKLAYEDLVAKNRASVPRTIQINVEDFNASTTDGQNEKELLDKFAELVEKEKRNDLAGQNMSSFEKYCLWGGAAIAGIGAVMLVFSQIFFGLVALVAGVGAILFHFSKKKQYEEERARIKWNAEHKLEEGTKIIRATLAEVVDYREEYASNDSESQKVLDFIDLISPDKYVRRMSETINDMAVAV
jgi:hypothetical protein